MTRLLDRLKKHQAEFFSAYHTRKIKQIEKMMFDAAKAGHDCVGVEFDPEDGTMGPILDYFQKQGIITQIYSASSNCVIYSFSFDLEA
jgi:hypothetical protein